MTTSPDRTVRLQPRPGEPPRARAVYRADDSALVVRPEGAPSWPTARQSLDTLTLMFGGPAYTLVGFDAYTRSDRWERGAVELPDAEPAVVVSLAMFDENGIAPGPLDAKLHWRFDDESRALEIVLRSGQAASAYRCLDHCVCVLDETGELLALYVERLEVEDAA